MQHYESHDWAPEVSLFANVDGITDILSKQSSTDVFKYDEQVRVPMVTKVLSIF